jgi:hypothetical protein
VCYPIANQEEIAAVQAASEKERIKRRFAAQGYIVTLNNPDDVQHYRSAEEIMEKEGYFRTPEAAEEDYSGTVERERCRQEELRLEREYPGYRQDKEKRRSYVGYARSELGRAAVTATVSRRTSAGTSVPDHAYRQHELDLRQHALMDAVPELLTGWATSPLARPVQWHAEWIAARQKYVRSGDQADLDTMRSFVTFDSPPLLADVQAAQATPARVPLGSAFYALSLLSALIAVVLTVGWLSDSTPVGVPVTLAGAALISVLWRVWITSRRQRIKA